MCDQKARSAAAKWFDELPEWDGVERLADLPEWDGVDRLGKFLSDSLSAAQEVSRPLPLPVLS